MTYHSPILAELPARPTARIAVLRCEQKFSMDPAPLQTLFAALSDYDAEDIICRALEDIALKLDGLQTSRTTGDYAAIAAPAKRMGAIADQIGLTDVAMIARHVAQASDMQCSVALGALLARLERAFDAAVSHIWDFRLYN